MDWDERWWGGEREKQFPQDEKQGATHEKVINQDAHQWMPQAEKARRER